MARNPKQDANLKPFQKGEQRKEDRLVERNLARSEGQKEMPNLLSGISLKWLQKGR